MKPRNFPGRKALRKLVADRNANDIYGPLKTAESKAIEAAQAVRTKKRRS